MEYREMYELPIRVQDESPDYPPDQLWAKMELALALVRAHAPVWIRRMRDCGVEIRVERTPDTRAKLIGGRTMVLFGCASGSWRRYVAGSGIGVCISC